MGLLGVIVEEYEAAIDWALDYLKEHTGLEIVLQKWNGDGILGDYYIYRICTKHAMTIVEIAFHKKDNYMYSIIGENAGYRIDLKNLEDPEFFKDLKRNLDVVIKGWGVQ